jgi:hypothetical protein
MAREVGPVKREIKTADVSLAHEIKTAARKRWIVRAWTERTTHVLLAGGTSLVIEGGTCEVVDPDIAGKVSAYVRDHPHQRDLIGIDLVEGDV